MPRSRLTPRTSPRLCHGRGRRPCPLTRPSLQLKKLRSRLMLRPPFPILQRSRPVALPLTRPSSGPTSLRPSVTRQPDFPTPPSPFPAPRPNLQLKPWRSRLLRLMRPLNLLGRSLPLLLLRTAPTLLRSPATLKYNPRPLLTIFSL